MKLGRRNFVRALGAAGVLTPLGLRLLADRAYAAGPMRALFVYVPDGCIPSRWHATGSETSFTLPDMASPLESIRADCTFLDGIDMYAGGNTHEGGIAKVLTGVSDESLDIALGREIGTETPFDSLQLGVATSFENGNTSMSFLSGSSVLPDDNPLNVFERLFGGGAMNDPQAELRRRQNASVLDVVAADAMDLRARVDGRQREKVDTFLASVEQVERRLAGGGNAACAGFVFNEEGFAVRETDYYPRTYHLPENFGLVGKLQMDLAVMALSCGLTRSCSLMWSHAVSPTHLPETGFDVGNHDASHCGGPSTPMAESFVAMRHWFLERFVYLIEELRRVPEGDGTVLDHTVVLLCSELGDSDLHDHSRVPFVIAGGSHGGIRGGRWLDYRGSHDGENAPHTKLLVSIAQGSGSAINSFGYTGHGTGPLEGIRS